MKDGCVVNNDVTFRTGRSSERHQQKLSKSEFESRLPDGRYRSRF